MCSAKNELKKCLIIKTNYFPLSQQWEQILLLSPKLLLSWKRDGRGWYSLKYQKPFPIGKAFFMSDELVSEPVGI